MKSKRNLHKSKSKKYRKTLKSLKCSKMYGSVCSSQHTINANGKPFAGINEYTQITINDNSEPLWARGIQLWRGTTIADMEGYFKEQDWNNPKNFKVSHFVFNICFQSRQKINSR